MRAPEPGLLRARHRQPDPAIWFYCAPPRRRQHPSADVQALRPGRWSDSTGSLHRQFGLGQLIAEERDRGTPDGTELSAPVCSHMVVANADCVSYGRRRAIYYVDSAPGGIKEPRFRLETENFSKMSAVACANNGRVSYRVHRNVFGM